MARIELSENELARVRGQAIAAAKRLFAKGGAPALSLRRVASEIGFSTGGLCRYFPGGRDESLAAVRVEGLMLLEELLRRASADANDPVEGIERMGDALLDFAKRYPAEFELLFVYTEGDWKSYPRLVELNERSWQPLESIVEQGIDQGIFQGNPKVLARSFYAAMMGAIAIFLSAEDDPLLSIDSLRDSLFGLLLRGATPLQRLMEIEQSPRQRSSRKQESSA
jgi:AcrR family transcriptional regulator